MYGKGTWEIEKNVILFSFDQNGLDTKHTLDFNNSKARYDRKLFEAKYGKEINTSLRFFESNIFWIKGRTLIKIQ